MPVKACKPLAATLKCVHWLGRGEATHGINRKKAADLCVKMPVLPEPGCEIAAEA